MKPSLYVCPASLCFRHLCFSLFINIINHIKIDIQKNLFCWIKELVKTCFAEVSATRIVGRCSHLLSDVLMIGLYSYISAGTYYQGKKQRGVFPTTRSNCGLYLLNVRVSENRFCPYQKEVQDKSNGAYYQSLAREHWDIIISSIGCLMWYSKKILAGQERDMPQKIFRY